MEIDQTILRQQYDTLATMLSQKEAPTEQQAELLDGLLNVLEDLLEPPAEEDTESDDKWSVSHYVDEDGHLNVFVKHKDNTEIDLVDEEVSSDDTGNEYGVRFTTQKIESDYKSEAFDRSFPELSNAAAGLMALKAMQDADFGSKIADMIIGPLEK